MQEETTPGDYERLVEAERLARERIALLAEADARLASTLDPSNLPDEIVRLLVPRYAEACSLHLLEEGNLKTMAVTHREREKKRSRSEPISDAAASVLRLGRPRLVAKADAIANEPARCAHALLPLAAQGIVFGVLEVDAGPRAFNADDLAFLEIFSHRSAVALDHARLYQAAEEARWVAELTAERVSRLQALTAALSEATTASQLAEIVVRQAIEAMGGYVAGVVEVTDEGASSQMLAIAGLDGGVADQYRRLPLMAALPWTEALRTGAEVFHSNADEWITPELEHGMLHGVLALACLPLVLAGGPEGGSTAGRKIGVLFLGFDSPHRFVESERAFLKTIAQQLAQALDRARLYDVEHRTRLAAEAANRAKDEFLGVVSHELRTPLTAILGWAQILRSREHDAAKCKRGLEVIERNARAQMRIVEDILDVSRIIAGKLKLELKPTDLLDIVKSAADVVRPAADAKGVELRVTPPAENIPLVAGDADRLQQIVWNLLSNAVRFTDRDGTVEVTLGRSASSVMLTVIDNGAGIEPALMPYIFDRFRQADASAARRHSGLGLGLAIVRHLAELHGGSVHAESDGIGMGARFMLSLPVPAVAAAARKAGTALPPRVPTPLPPGVSLDGLRVLLVEDDADARGVLVEVLSAYSAIVRPVDSAEAAIQALDEFAPDVLLTDIGLPGEDGFALLGRVRALPSPNHLVPAVALTAYARDADVRRALGAGFHAHLAKPVGPERLSAALATAAGWTTTGSSVGSAE
jgi:signal transduction histidine kinase/ActR/RegA family two-component response regulator